MLVITTSLFSYQFKLLLDHLHVYDFRLIATKLS